MFIQISPRSSVIASVARQSHEDIDDPKYKIIAKMLCNFMNKFLALFYLLLTVSTANAEQISESFSAYRASTVSEFANHMYIAQTKKWPLPHISKHLTSATDQQAAIARLMFVHLRLKSSPDVPISGYKAGLTSKAGQKKFNVSGAISGVLFESGKVNNGGTLKLSDYRQLMLETEIGFILNQDIDTPITDIKHLQTKISAVVPVIEMPNLAFADLKNITGQDIVASNAVANRYLLGEAAKLPVDFSLNRINTTLVHTLETDHKTVNQGSGKDALGDQWQALLWLVNERLESGYHLSKGQFLITGALGKMIPAQTGDYHADYGPLGKLTFTITD